MNYSVQGSDLTAIADSIRAKTGGSEGLEFPTDFVSGIGTLVDLTTATSDATATASDILSLKTAYVNGQRVVGNFKNYADVTFEDSVVFAFSNTRTTEFTIPTSKTLSCFARTVDLRGLPVEVLRVVRNGIEDPLTRYNFEYGYTEGFGWVIYFWVNTTVKIAARGNLQVYATGYHLPNP